MTEWKFIPFTNEYGIAGTSYQLVMGRVNDSWSMRLIKDSTILKQQMFSNPDSHGKKNMLADKDYFPETERLIGWVRVAILLPNVNEYSISRTVKMLKEEARANWAKFIEKKKSGGKGERNSIKLEHVNVEDLHRFSSQGRVLEDDEIKDPKILRKRIKDLENENSQLRKEKNELELELNKLRNESGKKT